MAQIVPVLTKSTAPNPRDSDFRNEVEVAPTSGKCMFCSQDAALRFRGDDSVRICERCVRPR